MRKLASISAVVLALFSITALLIWTQWGRTIFTSVGALGTSALLYYIFFPERAKIIASDIARLVGFISSGVRKFAVKNEVEGYINVVSNEFDRECEGAMPYPIGIRWITKETAPSSYIESERVIVRLRYKDPEYLNVVAAAIAYCRAGLIPETRQYIRKPLLRAIDLKVVDLILNRHKMREGQKYFRESVLQKAFQIYDNVEAWFTILRDFEDRGYFKRIFLVELAQYPDKAENEVCNEPHRKEICDFVLFLKNIAECEPGIEVNLDFLGKRLQIGIIIVGKSFKLVSAGHVPYLKQVELCRDRGVETIYMVGVRGGAREIPGIIKEAEALGLVSIIDSRKLPRVRYRNGTIVSGHSAQLEVKLYTQSQA